MPTYKEYPDDLAKSDPLVPGMVKLPRSVLALATVMAKRRVRTRQFIIREVLTEWAIATQKSLEAEVKELVEAEVRARARAAGKQKGPGRPKAKKR